MPLKLRRDDVFIPIGPAWSELNTRDVVASVALASIEVRRDIHIDHSNLPHKGRGDRIVPGDPVRVGNSLWSVDNCRVAQMNGRILLQSAVAVGGSGSTLWKVVYHANAIGILA